MTSDWAATPGKLIHIKMFKKYPTQCYVSTCSNIKHQYISLSMHLYIL